MGGVLGAGELSAGTFPPLLPPKSLFKNGNVAVLPSSSESSSPPPFSMSIRLSTPLRAFIISPLRLSRSSSEMPIFSSISSTGFMCSSRAHFRHSPSFFCSLPSTLVINTIATFLPQREHIFACIVYPPFQIALSSTEPNIRKNLLNSPSLRVVMPIIMPQKLSSQHRKTQYINPCAKPSAAPPYRSMSALS